MRFDYESGETNDLNIDWPVQYLCLTFSIEGTVWSRVIADKQTIDCLFLTKTMNCRFITNY